MLGYDAQTSTSQPALVQAYSFGLVAASDLITGNANSTQVSLRYGSEAIRTYDVACYFIGTRIMTADGKRPVEDLVIGDALPTVSGEPRPIRWIGRRSYSARFLRGKPEVLPVCFKAGSIDDGVLGRDLWISPKHAMFLDGVLIPA